MLQQVNIQENSQKIPKKNRKKSIAAGCAIAFSMYSKIPMPKVDWSEENMAYAFGFFPCVGVVIGAAMSLWAVLIEYANLAGSLFSAAVFLLLPLIITGGIHVDGFMDTCDAHASYGTAEEKLNIMKDPHSGAFAVIACVSYCMLFAGTYGLFEKEEVFALAGGFVLSRAMSGHAVTTLPLAKENGLAATFQKQTDKKMVFVLRIWMLLAAAWMVGFSGVRMFFPILFSMLLYFGFVYRVKKQYGGITGDLAGWFLCVCELGMAVVTAIVNLLLKLPTW